MKAAIPLSITPMRSAVSAPPPVLPRAACVGFLLRCYSTPSFEGWPVRYSTNVRPPAGDPGAGMLGSDHGAELYTVAAWCDRFWGRQFPDELTTQDWLSYSEQTFLTVTGGAVFHDDFGELASLRKRMAYFPRDVWLYKLAAQWGRIAEERAYVGRAGDAGDDIGSRVIAARMVGISCGSPC